MAFNIETIKNINIYQLPQSVYDNMVRNGEIDDNSLYLTTDTSENVGTTKEALTVLLNGKSGVVFDGSEAKTLDITPNSIGAATKFQFTNIAVPTSSWTDSTVNENYPYQAIITISGATSDMTPEVFFSFSDAISGNFAPVASSSTDSVIIYAKEAPSESTTISQIMLWK